jgi:hypothetical protein
MPRGDGRNGFVYTIQPGKIKSVVNPVKPESQVGEQYAQTDADQDNPTQNFHALAKALA